MQLFDMVTILTITGIVVILALYVLVVYKKGWLKGDSNTLRAYYRCPNQKCRRVFEEPVWLRDLSQAPPESYQACPHCGFNLQAVPSFVSSKTREHKLIIPQSANSVSEREQPVEKPKPIQLESSPKAASFKPAFKNIPQDTQNSANSRPSTPSNNTLQSEGDPPKIYEDKKQLPGNSRNCSHYFGYVKTLPKSTPIPDECMWCPQIVKCLTGTEKIEA
jgi:hypothetical protein